MRQHRDRADRIAPDTPDADAFVSQQDAWYSKLRGRCQRNGLDVAGLCRAQSGDADSEDENPPES
jgi:hypothetical protein